MLKNMMLLLISLTVALGAGEAMLRMFTPFRSAHGRIGASTRNMAIASIRHSAT
ncbi:hypothetical protein [Ensifer adhaerens]|uniref:hypothetical protein n=1 Tax=Ensifer adhaerens TaxID=106592 RepID=UPI00202E118E|nr:hypothetical protein [Ensifer adhaerens]